VFGKVHANIRRGGEIGGRVKLPRAGLCCTKGMIEIANAPALEARGKPQASGGTKRGVKRECGRKGGKEAYSDSRVTGHHNTFRISSNMSKKDSQGEVPLQ